MPPSRILYEEVLRSLYENNLVPTVRDENASQIDLNYDVIQSIYGQTQ